jgi:hypothetical protein
MTSSSSCGCGTPMLAGFEELAELRKPYVTGFLEASGRKIPVVSTRLSGRDVRGGWKVRWDIGRAHYTVVPGLYAVGSPTADSPVLVTANYKLTFDTLRKELDGIDAWLLVLDTKGINVWCAAGKGTFGTRELEQKIMAVRLQDVVGHRTLVLPQLAASGVSAHEVKHASGFRVKFGPVRAQDLPRYLAGGQKKDDVMRSVQFALTDRMVIAPTEVMHSWPVALAVLGAAALFAIPFDAGYFPRLLRTFLPLIGAVLMGTLVFPALLPYLPFRAFALKGTVLGAVWAIVSALAFGATLSGAAALLLLIAPIVAYLAMAFTGSSTFTCQPGAVLEVKRGVIPMISSLVLGIGLEVTTRVLVL